MKLLLQGLFWFLIALNLRLLLMLALHLYSVQAGFEGFYPLGSGSDDRYYHYTAIRLVMGEEVDGLPNVYPLVLAWLYSLFGPHLMVGKLVNVFLSSLSVYYGVRIAAFLESDKRRPLSFSRASNLAGLFLTIYPSSVFYATQLLKDPFILFLGTASLYWGLIITRKPRLRESILLLLSVAALFFFRGYAAVSFLLAFIFYYLVGRKVFSLQRAFVGLLLVVILPMLLGYGPAGFDYLLPLLEKERLTQFREEAYSTGGSAADISLDFSNPLGFLFSYGYSFVTVLLGPLPWQVKSAVVAIALLEAVPFWFLLFLALGKRNQIAKEALLLLLFSLIYLGGVALFSDNIGANTRLRLLPWSVLLIYLALRFGRGAYATTPSLSHHPR